MHLILDIFLMTFLCWISITDIKKQIISNQAICVAIIIRLIGYLWLEKLVWQGLVVVLLNGLAIAGPILLLVLGMERMQGKELMGGGDIKLLFVIGLYIGWEKSLIAFLLACIIGIIVGVVQMRKANIYFSFGPAIALGTVASMWIG